MSCDVVPGSQPLALELYGVSKCFHVYAKPHLRLVQSFCRGRRKLYDEFWALQDITFSIKRGETVGIVGRNGAGKSTLLQIICGILQPTNGEVIVNGRVAALLELGAGFNPEFTGRENVFLNGAILGLSTKEIQERFDEIAAFADIGSFLDQPVKTYSSGMYIRLAFAVATCVSPDILIVDEALAVGDVKFQAKCFRRFEQLVNSGTTILFVTHSTEQIVRHCSWAILVEQGRILERGESKSIANRYLDLLFGVERNGNIDANPPGESIVSMENRDQVADVVLNRRFEDRSTYNAEEYRWGNGKANIVDYLVTRDGCTNLAVVEGKERFEVVFAVIFAVDIERPVFGLTIKTPDGVTLGGDNSRDCQGGPIVQSVRAGERKLVRFELTQSLCAGDYLLSVGVVEDQGDEMIPLDRRYDAIFLHVQEDGPSYGLVDFDVRVSVQ